MYLYTHQLISFLCYSMFSWFYSQYSTSVIYVCYFMKFKCNFLKFRNTTFSAQYSKIRQLSSINSIVTTNNIPPSPPQPLTSISISIGKISGWENGNTRIEYEWNHCQVALKRLSNNNTYHGQRYENLILSHSYIFLRNIFGLTFSPMLALSDASAIYEFYIGSFRQSVEDYAILQTK